MDRTRARTLAREAIARGEPTAWFERLYREAHAGTTIVPWADRVPNPHLVAWLDHHPLAPGRALDVGTGLGDNAEELARRGQVVTAFDVSATAIAEACRRFPASSVTYRVGDLLAPPAAWRAAFEFVAETYTLQVLPPAVRRIAARVLCELVAGDGVLLVIARGREPAAPQGTMPWPLVRGEIEAMATNSLGLESFEDFLDAEDPPVRRFRATFRRR